jgi:hypothetical protein
VFFILPPHVRITFCLPRLLQTTFYSPHPPTELLWCHFIEKAVTSHIHAFILLLLYFLGLLLYPHP